MLRRSLDAALPHTRLQLPLSPWLLPWVSTWHHTALLSIMRQGHHYVVCVWSYALNQVSRGYVHCLLRAAGPANHPSLVIYCLVVAASCILNAAISSINTPNCCLIFESSCLPLDWSTLGDGGREIGGSLVTLLAPKRGVAKGGTTGDR